MKNNILTIPGKLEFDITEIYKEPFIRNKNIGSLSRVLNFNLNLDYLSEVKEGIEKTKATKEESLKYQKENNLISVDRDQLKPELLDTMGIMLPCEWGAEPGWECTSYKNITEIGNPFDESIKTEYYSTPEVLQVLDQWIEYLQKWEAEKGGKKQEVTTPKDGFLEKLKFWK